MQQWDIQPFIGAGTLRFGMSRADTRRLLAGHASIEREVFNSKHVKGAYESLDLDLRFDTDVLVMIEAYNLNAVPWVYDGISAFEHSMRSFATVMVNRGVRLSFNSDEGYWLESIGMSIYQPRFRDKIATLALFSASELEAGLAVMKEIEERRREREKHMSDPRFKPPKNPFLGS